jgi:uncharacterized membrane protein
MIWNTDYVCLLFADDIKVALQLYIQIIQTQKGTEKNQLQFTTTDKLKKITTLISQSQKI